MEEKRISERYIGERKREREKYKRRKPFETDETGKRGEQQTRGAQHGGLYIKWVGNG